MVFIVILLFLLFIWFLVRKEKQNKSINRHKLDLPPNQKDAYHQGYYAPRYPKKYHGDISGIFFRSNWELIAFQWCDLNYGVVAWASEELAIPYRMKGIWYEREYYPDLLIYFKSGETVMIEIKPNDQKINPNYENRCKWAAARAYCNDRGWAFRIWNEATIEKLRPNVKKWKSQKRR